MPVKAEQELLTLNVQQLNLKTNLYGNILMTPINGKGSEASIQKAKSLDKVFLSDIKSSNGNHDSIISIDSKTKSNENLKKMGLEQPKTINRYDSGYGSYVEFHSETTFSESRETLIEEPDHLNDVDHISGVNQYGISEWPIYTDPLSSLEATSSYTIYSSSVNPSNQSSITSPTPTPPPNKIQLPQTEIKRNEYTRLIERFGTDMKDTCLFPLALPMDGSDVFKGASTWESLTLLADCVLSKWIDSAKSHYKPLNKVLPNATKFFCPNPELEGRLIQFPNACVPLRRTKSELDLFKLGFKERKDLLSQTNKSKMNAVKDDININVSNEKGRYRTQTSLSLRKNSVQFSVSKARKDRFDLKVSRNLKTDAKALVQSIRIENPISLALQITKIEKDLMLNLAADEVMSVVINRGKSYHKNSGIRKMMEFGQELSQLIADIIAREITVEAQGKKIAAIIEVACVLRKLRNWQSLSSLIRGLQMPQIYGLSTAWSVTKAKYPIHFNDYLRLCQVVRFDSVAILRSREPSIPSISSFISLLRIRCLATWDRLERAPRWKESPSLVQWLERQMLTSMAIQKSIESSNERIASEMDKKLKKRKDIKLKIEAFHEKRETHIEKCLKELSPERASFMPLNDPIYFIEDDHLPSSWTLRSARNIPAVHQSKIVRCFNNSYKVEISHIQNYNINS